jgi:predicted transcriptional regulator
MALERIETIQLGTQKAEEVGCPWYILSPEHHFCFWLFARELDVSYTNREIAELLGLNPDAVDKIATAAIQKWRDIAGSQVMIDFKEALRDSVTRNDETTVYYPDQLCEIAHKSAIADIGKVEEEDEDASKVEKKKPKVKIKKKACKKVHLYGLYSVDALKRVREENK